MRPSVHLLTICFVASSFAASSVEAQKEAVNPQAIASAKTICFKDDSGSDAVGNRALAELLKWGRFQITKDPKQADLIIVLSTDPHQAGDLILSGGQTGTIDPQGHVQEDAVPSYNKVGPVRHLFLFVTDAATGTNLWTSSQRWGGLLTGFDSAGERLIKEFEKAAESPGKNSHFTVVKRVDSQPCPTGQSGHPWVEYEEQHLPMKSDHRGELKVVGNRSVPLPSYPERAINEGVEGELELFITVASDGDVVGVRAIHPLDPTIDAAAIATVKTWKFKVTRGEQAGFPIKFRYRLTCTPAYTK